jgi:hypothetical protein
LELYIAVMRQPEPPHVGKDRLDMLGPTPRPVNILDPKAKLTPKSVGKLLGT